MTDNDNTVAEDVQVENAKETPTFPTHFNVFGQLDVEAEVWAKHMNEVLADFMNMMGQLNIDFLAMTPTEVKKVVGKMVMDIIVGMDDLDETKKELLVLAVAVVSIATNYKIIKENGA